jgi:hypothetical protein
MLQGLWAILPAALFAGISKVKTQNRLFFWLFLAIRCSTRYSKVMVFPEKMAEFSAFQDKF